MYFWEYIITLHDTSWSAETFMQHFKIIHTERSHCAMCLIKISLEVEQVPSLQTPVTISER